MTSAAAPELEQQSCAGGRAGGGAHLMLSACLAAMARGRLCSPFRKEPTCEPAPINAHQVPAHVPIS